MTSSKARRDNRNPLWEANLVDGLIRHSSANHKRETIAWSKRRAAAAEKLAVFVIWRNYMKGRREKVRGSPTPAMARGMTDRAWTIQDVLAERLFPSLVRLPGRWRMYYERGIATRGARNRVERRRRYAA
ncbi:MAG: hypothetical protein IH621_06250 [Krumholzibacteria bacterium]|nr:hypothetical protein [Candidatus Krumholzibacteria bacterium]